MPTGRSVANVTEYTIWRFRYVRAGDLSQGSQYYTTASVVGEMTLQAYCLLHAPKVLTCKHCILRPHCIKVL